MIGGIAIGFVLGSLVTLAFVTPWLSCTVTPADVKYLPTRRSSGFWDLPNEKG